MTMLKLGAAVIIGLWGMCLSARADSGFDLPIRNMKQFADVRAQLQVLVNAIGFQETNKFCVVSSSDPSDYDAEVYWPTENKLILWEVQYDQTAIIDSRDFVDLQRDVVASAKDITLAYMILPWTRAEVNAIIHDCLRYGNYYTIYKTEDHWVSIKKYALFSHVQIQLQTLVDQQGHVRKNDICVVGQKYNSYLAAYVYWPAENRLMLWLPDPRWPYSADELTTSYSEINLKKDVYDKEYKNYSMTEMSRSYVQKVLVACQEKGERFTIIKSD